MDEERPISPAQSDYLPQSSAPATAAQQLVQAVNQSNAVLLKATTVFPFTLFPDTVIIDRTKLTVSRRSFFRVAEVMSWRIEDILNVIANVGPFFGSIKIANRFFAEKSTSVNYLSRNDALKIKYIMQGFIIATQKKIDLSSLSNQALRELLDELGQASSNEEM
jgi:hypothetical protein